MASNYAKERATRTRRPEVQTGSADETTGFHLVVELVTDIRQQIHTRGDCLILFPRIFFVESSIVDLSNRSSHLHNSVEYFDYGNIIFHTSVNYP